MKAVFFDVDDLTFDYLEKNKIKGVEYKICKYSANNIPESDLFYLLDAEVLSFFVTSTGIDGKFLDKFKNVKLIANRSTGFNNIDLEYCKEKGIEVVNVPRYGEATVAEYTYGMLLTLVRKIARARRDLKNGNCANLNRYMGIDLFNKTIGIVGTGAIGRHSIKIAKGFQMKILAYDLYPNQEFAKEEGFEYVSLEELYKNSDIISLHCPSTPDNYHMLDEKAFKQMKDGVIILNTSRGELINAEDLYDAVVSKKVGGAALDVLEYERSLVDFKVNDTDMPEDGILLTSFVNLKLMQLSNVLLTPHIAFNSIDAVHRILSTSLDNIKAFSEDRIQNSVIKR
ncbi:MAG: D-lactate dehydrogenase [Alphaproteobacteria bacterium ADurb.Bin438]|nr:MAG: D-lactate dehydrogenase [Alphaproteobacteria bacterium ADurb.Bin438]